MEEKKLNPIDMVAREMEPHSALPNSADIRKQLMSVYTLLETRAGDSLKTDPNSQETLDRCKQFCVVAELINFFGSQLIAYEDIERENMVGRPPAN